jgi:hypothetical protein
VGQRAKAGLFQQSRGEVNLSWLRLESMNAVAAGIFPDAGDNSFSGAASEVSRCDTCNGAFGMGQGNGGANMGNNCDPDELDVLRSVDSYQEMESNLSCLRSLVCDLLKTNQELRDALADAEIDARWGEGRLSSDAVP